MKRATFAFMAVLVSADFGGRFALSDSAGAQVDLVARLTAADLAKLGVYPSQPSQLTLYDLTLRDDVLADDIID